MKVRQDPVSKLWCREDGAVLLPPSGTKFKKFRWTFGCDHGDGYRQITYHREIHLVHRLVCRAFHGLPPEGKPFCDHKNRVREDNRSFNLHWVNIKENNDNSPIVDRAFREYGVRQCDDPKAYHKAHNAALAAEKKAQGMHYCKDSTGKWGWYPRVHP